MSRNKYYKNIKKSSFQIINFTNTINFKESTGLKCIVAIEVEIKDKL